MNTFILPASKYKFELKFICKTHLSDAEFIMIEHILHHNRAMTQAIRRAHKRLLKTHQNIKSALIIYAILLNP